MRSSIAKAAALAALLAICSSECTSRMEGVRGVPQVCEAPPTLAGDAVQLKALVVAQADNDLHMDFDRFGADFSSITVQFNDPPAWRGVRTKLYYQGDAVVDGVVLGVGMSFRFSTVPPDCLDRPWFLHAITDES